MTTPSAVPVIVVAPIPPRGVFALGEPVTWEIQLGGEGASDLKELTYTLHRNGLTEIGQGTIDVSYGDAMLKVEGLAEPGSLLVRVAGQLDSGVKLEAHGGALIAPEMIRPTLPCPADFEEFWAGKLAALAQVPMNAVLEPAPSLTDDVESWKVTLDNLGGAKVQARLAKPKREGKFPALIIVQWAGVYGLEPLWSEERAREGWLVLNVLAHDLPIDETPAFYAAQGAGPLEDYRIRGRHDREKSYFLGMFLGAARAADYLASRPEWDGHTFVAAGASQGGYQAVVVAALEKRITAVLARVPAGCDHAAGQNDCLSSWPHWLNSLTPEEDAAAVLETSRYFDAANFASLVRVPALVSPGIIDLSCPVRNVMAMVNQLQGPTELLLMPLAAHQEISGSQNAFFERQNQWLAALVQGAPTPSAASGLTEVVIGPK